jgi:hypothetical protein
MRLDMTNASTMLDAISDLDTYATEIQSAAEGYIDLDGENTADARETRAEHRGTWEENIDELESRVIELAGAFGYVVLSAKEAKKLGWKPPTRA